MIDIIIFLFFSAGEIIYEYLPFKLFYYETHSKFQEHFYDVGTYADYYFKRDGGRLERTKNFFNQHHY